MKYTTYYEQTQKMNKKDEDELKESLHNDKLTTPLESIVLRKLNYASITTEVSEVHYNICMKNEDENEIYLQRKNIQNGMTYKTIAHITKQQCESLLVGDYQWLQESKLPLCKEFYLQLTVNQLPKCNIIEIHKEVCHRKHDYITFTHVIKGISYRSDNFFNTHCYMIPLFSDPTTIVSVKRAVTIPRYIRNMVHMTNENNDMANLAFIL